jgi:hypothetical protein
MSDIVALPPECFIASRIKVFPDMKERREKENLSSNDEKQKHLKDTVRLSIMLTGDEVLNLPSQIKRI